MASVAFRQWATCGADDGDKRFAVTGIKDGVDDSKISPLSANETAFETTLANTLNRYSGTECVPVSDDDLENLQKVKAAAYAAYKYTWREYFVRFRACAGKKAFDYEPSVKVKNAGVWNTFITSWRSCRSKRKRERRDTLLKATAALLEEVATSFSRSSPTIRAQRKVWATLEIDDQGRRSAILHFFNGRQMRDRTKRASRALTVLWELLFHKPNHTAIYSCKVLAPIMMMLKCADARLSLQASDLVFNLARIARATTEIESNERTSGTKGVSEVFVASQVETMLLRVGVLESLVAVSRQCLSELRDPIASSNPFSKELKAIVGNVSKALDMLIQRDEVKHRLIECGGLKRLLDLVTFGSRNASHTLRAVASVNFKHFVDIGGIKICMETLRSAEEKHVAQREGILMFLCEMFFLGNGTLISFPDAKRIFLALLAIQGESIIHTHFPIAMWYCACRIVDLLDGKDSVRVSHEAVALMTQNWLKFRPAQKGVAFVGVVSVVLSSSAFTVDSPEELVDLRSSLSRSALLWRNLQVDELRCVMAAMYGLMRSHESHLDALWGTLGPTNTIVEVAADCTEIHLKRHAMSCLSFSLRNRKSAGSAVSMLGEIMHSCNDRIVLEHCAVSLGCMAADDANRRFFCNNGLLLELFSVATSAFKAGQSCLLTCVYFAVLRMIEMEPNAREIYRTLRFVKLLLATVGTIDESHYARSLAVSIISCLIENEKNAEWTSVSRERGRFAELLLKYLEQDLELHRVRELERVRDGQVPATVAGSTGNALISWERIQLVRALFTSGAVEGDKEKSILRYLGLMLRADQSVGERSFAAKCVARLALLPRYSSCLHSHRGLLRDLHGLATQEVVAHNKNEIEVALAALVNASQSPQTQKIVASFGMESILRILDGEEYASVDAARSYGEALVFNLSRNPCNVTNVYTGELQHKMQLAASTFLRAGEGAAKLSKTKGLIHSSSAPSKLHILVPPQDHHQEQRPQGHEQQHGSVGDKRKSPRTRFGEWVDDLRIEKPKSPTGIICNEHEVQKGLKLPRLQAAKSHAALETSAARVAFGLLVRQSQSRSLKSPMKIGVGFNPSGELLSPLPSPLSCTLLSTTTMSLVKEEKLFKLVPTQENKWSSRELFPSDLKLDFQRLVLRPLRSRSALSASVVNPKQLPQVQALRKLSRSNLVPLPATNKPVQPKMFAGGIVQDTFLHLCCEFINMPQPAKSLSSVESSKRLSQPWKPERSPFAERINCSESASVIDVERVYLRSMTRDVRLKYLQRVSSGSCTGADLSLDRQQLTTLLYQSMQWRRMQQRGDKLQSLKKYCSNGNLEDIRNYLSRLFPKLARAFDFYAAMGHDLKNYQLLNQEQWGLFLRDCAFVEISAVDLDAAETGLETRKWNRHSVVSPGSVVATRSVKWADAKAVFDVCCCKEKEKGMLRRYEFLEAICHLSVLLYIKDEGNEVSLLAQALPLLGQQLGKKIQTSVIEDANGWRERRLYRHDVDAALRPVVGMLKSLFVAFAADSAADKDPRMDLAEWFSFMEDHGLRDNCLLSHRQIAESFLLGKMRIADEESANWSGMAFEDFLEAVARIADNIEWPLDGIGKEHGAAIVERIRRISVAKEDSEVGDTAAREKVPLGKKVTALVETIFSVLDQ